MHFTDLECTSVKEYYKCVVVIPFLDHLITELTSRIDENAKKVSMIQGLLLVQLISLQSHLFLAFRKQLNSTKTIHIRHDKNLQLETDGCQFLHRVGPSP